MTDAFWCRVELSYQVNFNYNKGVAARVLSSSHTIWESKGSGVFPHTHTLDSRLHTYFRVIASYILIDTHKKAARVYALTQAGSPTSYHTPPLELFADTGPKCPSESAVQQGEEKKLF